MKYLTLDEARRRVEALRALTDDHERAHAEEGCLHLDCLVTIADDQTADPRALAAVVLQTRMIPFARWYA